VPEGALGRGWPQEAVQGPADCGGQQGKMGFQREAPLCPHVEAYTFCRHTQHLRQQSVRHLLGARPTADTVRVRVPRDAGLAHVQCRIAAAEHKYKSSGTIVAWNDCPTCCQSYRGQIAIGLAEEHFRQAQNRPERLEEWVLAAYLLANTLLGVGWIADAERVSRETLTKFDRMGLDDNFGSMRELRKASAHALDTQGKYADAHVIFTRCLAEHRQLYGPDNILTLRAAKALGNNLNRQAMYDKAVAILQDTLERCKRGLDPEDYLTLECASLLAMVLSAQGNANEAQAAFEQLMPVMKRVLGPDHQEVLQAATNCALSFLRSGRLVEGEAMLVETLAAQKRTLGDEHPLTVHSASILRSLRKKM
jgi:hypothetical protein